MLVSPKLRPRGAYVFATTVSVLALAIVTSPSLAQDAPPAPDLPPVEVPQVAPDEPPKPKPKKPKPAAAKPKPTPAAPAPDVVEEVRPADPAVALGTYNPALDVRDLELPPGTTLTTAGPVVGYKALTAMSSTKTATPIDNIPQSIQVVPKSLIDDQRVFSVDEAVRNVSGVQGTNPLQTPAYESAKIRGFSAETWLDGLTLYYNPGDRDALANVERIEVLKGPAAILYGGGAGAPVGGAINIVSKLPTGEAGGEVGFTYGSDNFLRPYIDVNQPLNADGTVLFRITGEYVSSDSFIDVIETERYSINPTLTLTDKENTTLTIQGRATSWEQQEYQGLPATGTVAGNFDIRRDLFIGPSDIPDSTSEVQGVTVTLDHKFNEMVSANVKARWSQSEFNEIAQSIYGPPLLFLPDFQANTPAVPPSTWGLANTYLEQDVEEFTVNPNLLIQFSAGETRNKLLFGADYSRLTDVGYLTVDLLVAPPRDVNLANPSFPFPYVRPPKNGFTTILDADNVYETKGLYTQLQSDIYDRLHLLAGLRLANVQIDYTELSLATTTVTEETKLLPRIGAVYDLVPGLSVYASYSEGLKAVPFALYSGAPKPEESDQLEGGIKFNAGGLSGTLAVFEINRENTPVLDVTDPFRRSIAAGTERSRGFEADVIWQPTPAWQVLANYAFIDAEFTDSLAGVPAGNKLNAVPEHSGRIWVNYLFEDQLKGWSAGAGIYASSGQFIDETNLFETESYFTVDAKIGYDTETFSAALNVKNLTDEEYFVPYSYFGGRVAPGADRTFFGTVIYRY